MMKSFFKKLAFVMALAMVVSLAAPAAAKAVAANDLQIRYQNGRYNVEEINIAKLGAIEDLKFVGAPDYKEVGFNWESSNPAVATVNPAGEVQAVAAGTAVITLTVGDRTDSVKVNVVNIPTYEAYMGTSKTEPVEELTFKVGDAPVDLAFFGIKDYDTDRYECTWYEGDKAVATVDNKGVITPVGEGTTIISLSVYNDAINKKHNVKSIRVTVKGEEPVATATPIPTPVVEKDAFTVAHKDTDKFVLTFEGEKTVEEIRENLVVSYEIAGKDYTISFENIEVDGKKVTVTTYELFENGDVYTFTYGDQVRKCSIVLGEIQSVGIQYYTGKNKENNFAYVMEEEEEDYVTFVPVLYDVYGNDITAKYNLEHFDFVYEVSENVKPNPVHSNNVFTFRNNGIATVDITASWITNDGRFVTIPGEASFVVEKRGAIALTLEKVGIANINENFNADQTFWTDDLYTYEIDPVNSFRLYPLSAVWNTNPGTTLTFYENQMVEPKYYYTAVFEDNRGNIITSNDSEYKFGTFTYESNNNEVLTITGDGEVVLHKAGRANILVYFTPADATMPRKLATSTTIIVNAEPYPASYEIVETSKTAASHVVVQNSTDETLNDVVLEVKFLDQNGKHYDNLEGLYALERVAKVEAREKENTYATYLNLAVDPVSKTLKATVDADDFRDAVVVLNEDKDEILKQYTSKQYSYKVSFDAADITKKVRTAYGVFYFNIKNTYDEYLILSDFLGCPVENDVRVNTLSVGEVPAKYEFYYGFGGNTTVDVAVKNIINYKDTKAQSIPKTKKITVNYLSSGGYAIAKVPTSKLVDITAGNPTTTQLGEVYYKVSGPSKTMDAGKSEDNSGRWGATDVHGNVQLTFNNVATGGALQYAANGTYTVSFATTRTDGGKINTVKTISATVSNSQNQVKYLGLNPEFNGVTDKSVYDYQGIVEEQLMFSFDEIFLGEYFEGYDFWYLDGRTNIDIDWDNSKITPYNDSVVISTLAFKVTVDNADGVACTYTSVVSVGARIKLAK